MNPPFGGKEGAAAQINFEYKTGATQVLFLQLAMKQLADGGRCGIVLDEGVLFRTNEQAFVKTKRKLLDENDLYCIVSLPNGAFSAAGAGVKTNLLFFNKGRRTEKIWYYDLSDVKIGKKSPLTLDKFDEFFRLLPDRADSERSWTIDFAARREKARQESEPYKQKVRQLENEAYQTKEKVKQLKQQSPQNKDEINKLQTKIAELDFQARENRSKAEAIENAIYDIKAVNPNAKDTTDKRTPFELLDFIAEKSIEVQLALEKLKAIS
jgi:type I restriction enzyme M protein